MAQTQTACPRCRQPILAQVEQLFDLNTDPQAKQRLLSGQINYARCPSCGYEGMLSIPVVYHDPAKELLLTYFPTELGLPINDQERMIGPLINQVVNNLKPEERKAYVLRPQSMLTFQTMVEKILEGDGITKEDIQKSQQRMSLLERLISISPASRVDFIKQEEANFDQPFFVLLSRIIEATVAQGDQNSARQLAEVQQALLDNTQLGQELKKQSEEVEKVVKTLQDASKQGLTREKILEILISTNSDAAVSTVVSLVRSGLDYTFFELLSEKINQADGEEKEKLTILRDKLLQLTSQIDKAMQVEMDRARKLLDTIMAASNVEQATMEHIEEMSDFFVEILKTELEAARKVGDLSRSSKLQQIVAVLQKANTPPPELALLDELLASENEAELDKKLEANREKITPEFAQVLNNIITQAEQQGQTEEFLNEARSLYRKVLAFSMKSALSK